MTVGILAYHSTHIVMDPTDHMNTLFVLSALVVERHEVGGESPVKLLFLWVQHEEDEVEPTQQGVGELDILNHRRLLVPFGHARVGGS